MWGEKTNWRDILVFLDETAKPTVLQARGTRKSSRLILWGQDLGDAELGAPLVLFRGCPSGGLRARVCTLGEVWGEIQI